jgi:CRISPR/Cas system CSM-associated protein Csm2 small subunit
LLNNLEKSNIMNDFYDYLRENEVEIKQKDVKISGKYIQNNIYAYIARQRFGDDEFYKVFYKYNNTVNKAIEILKEHNNLTASPYLSVSEI